ncbi:glycosyltransferase family 2 protein [Thermoflexus hugenholtzii]|uniref:Undecaprenyl-phosphate 4-deoxy-4-formamido-L-arabinose transferase n=1 Tax=Thermoflexus hugenholtzii JAD2 TaxID=877466 RepID=A0A212PZ86_9CHLR|nr:glycosyltransferase family 2 protein [Thermoflexus hugenholtzii]SNB52268.1 undecaprenyl-phosphate 4-deoxy-4-formamido-L-arabinose transferase [Thermoflexus hugenholtzii JAD2]
MEIRPEISVVIPIFRNRETLYPLYARLQSVLDGAGWSWELIAVHDACPEGSLKVLRELAANDERVRILDLPRNVGQHRAIWIGLHEVRGRYVVVMDADLQDPPEAIPLLRRTLEDSGGRCSVVFAGRRGRYEGITRLLTSWLFKRVLYLVCGVPVDAGAFCLMERRVVETLRRWDPPEPHLPTLIACAGFPACVIPVLRSPRPSGRSAYTARMRWRLGWRILRSAWALKRNPARFLRHASPPPFGPGEGIPGGCNHPDGP